MRPVGRWLVVCGLAWLALAGCAKPPATPEPMSGQSHGSGEWRGVLSRKGSEPGRYWALQDDMGRQWRLLPAAALREARLLELQGARVRITGRLSTDPAGDEIEWATLVSD